MRNCPNTQNSFYLLRSLCLLLVTSMLLSACNDAKQPVSPVTIIAPTAQAQGGQATRPLGSPVLVDRSPTSGEELQPDKPIELTFDQPMDKASDRKSVV